jgi:hypothetical protein
MPRRSVADFLKFWQDQAPSGEVLTCGLSGNPQRPRAPNERTQCREAVIVA